MPTRRPARKVAPADRVEELLGQREQLERQNAELLRLGAELEAGRERYAELFDRAPVALVVVTATGLIVELNEAAVSLFGRDRLSLARKPLALAIHLEHRRDFRRFLVACQRSTAELPFATELAGEPPRPVEVMARMGHDRRIQLSFVDLVRRGIAESARRDLLHRPQVSPGASVSRDRHLSALSHELRTPLTPVLAAVSALRRSGLPEEVQRLLGVIERSVDHEVRLIDDLLDVTRLTHRKMTFETKVMDLHGAVLEALELVVPDMKAKDLRLVQQLRAREHHVRGDQVRLRQVFANLLRNACKFTPTGGTITLQSRAGRSGVVVQVSDTGIGIPSGQLSMIFERFAQAPGAEQQGGLGLGLAIARGIVQGHHGRISVSSAGLGRGTTFEVELACVPAPAPRVVARRIAPTDGAGARPQRILLVEDHEDTAAVLSELLAAEGYRIERARSIGEAVSKATAATELVISDIGLPDGSGLEVMRQLRAQHLKIPGIALSGYGTREDRKQSRAAGFARHLVKPVKFEELVAAIREVRG